MSLREALKEHAALTFEQARMLPCGAYTCQEVLDTELASMFANEWVCLGRTASIPNAGDYFTGEIPGTHGARGVVVIRGDDGTARAFDNVCVHRGATLLEEACGHEARITCPYHAWVYRTDGQLIGGPYMNRTVDEHRAAFDPTALRLNELTVEVWEGFVFVSVARDPAPLAPRLSGLTELVAPFAMEHYVPIHRQIDVWQTNWKLLVENFMDAYHVFKVHRLTFAKDADNTLYTEMADGTDWWANHIVVHREATEEIAHPSNTTLKGMWRKAIVLAAVFPTHVVQLQANWLWYLQISPVGVDQVRVRWEVAVAPELLEAQPDRDAYVARVIDHLNLVNSEDRPIVERVFRGMKRPQFDRGPFSYLERNVYDFDRYIARTLTAANAADD